MFDHFGIGDILSIDPHHFGGFVARLTSLKVSNFLLTFVLPSLAHAPLRFNGELLLYFQSEWGFLTLGEVAPSELVLADPYERGFAGGTVFRVDGLEFKFQARTNFYLGE